MPSDHGARNIRRVLGNLFYYPVAEQLAILVPVAFAQAVRNVLNEAGHDVAIGWGQRVVGVRCDDTVNPEFLGNLAELGDVVTALGEFERGDEGVEGALQARRVVRSAGEARFFGEDQVYFGAGAGHLDAANGVEEIRR